MSRHLRLLPVILLALVLFAGGSAAPASATNAEPVHIVDEGNDNSGSADAVVFDVNKIGTVWQVHDYDAPNEKVMYETSGDGGHTWGGPIEVPSDRTFNSLPSIDYVQDQIIVAFERRNDTAAPGDVVYTMSNDDGAHWSDPKTLGVIKGFGPIQIAVAGQNVSVAWCCDESSKAVLVQSTNGGASFSQPFLFETATEEPQLAIEDGTHFWALIQHFTGSTAADLMVYRWEAGSDPVLKHSIPTYPYYSRLMMGARPSGGGPPPLYTYFQTLYSPAKVLIARLDATDGDSWHDPVETEISHTVGDAVLGVSPDFLVFAYAPTSVAQEFHVFNIISEDGGMTWGQPKTVTPLDIDAIVPTVYVKGERIINAYWTATGEGANRVQGAGLGASADRGVTYHTITLPDAVDSVGARIIPLDAGTQNVQTAAGPSAAPPPFLIFWSALNSTTHQYGVAFAPGAVTGDATCDNSVTGADLLATLSEAAGIGQAPCTAGADANCSGSVDVDDALRIVSYLASLPKAPNGQCMPVNV